MSHDMRQRQALRHRAVEQMQVGSADSAERYADLYLSRGWWNRHAGSNTKTLVSFEESGSHDAIW
jgi:hypothetical protein